MSLEAVVKVTLNGRITIPKEIMDKLGWSMGTKLKVLLNGERLILEATKGG